MTLIRRISAILCLIFLGALTAYPQTRSVTLSGKVIDSEDGAPLIGAAVLIEDTEYGTVTDLDGNYKLSIPEKECEVTFSCIGYEDVVKKFNIRNVGSFAEIVMRVNATQLEDVVVTGVYERKKESFMDGGAWWAAVHGVAKSRT